MPRIVRPDNETMENNNAKIDEYKWQTSSRFTDEMGFQDFACNIRSLPPGKFSYPYHFHHNSEEMMVILSGRGKMRTPDGITEFRQGDILLFEAGETGAHQIMNDGDKDLTYLDLRTTHRLDVCEYPDSGKVNMLPAFDVFKRGESASYFDGEEGITERWEELKGS